MHIQKKDSIVFNVYIFMEEKCAGTCQLRKSPNQTLSCVMFPLWSFRR